MIGQGFITNKKYINSINSSFISSNIELQLSHSIESFKADCLKRRPLVLFIQSDAGSALEVKNLVGDIRELFGISVTIIILGDRMSRKKLSNYITEGADQFFSYPFDEMLIGDFLSKRTGEDYFDAFKYRKVPPGVAEMILKFPLEVVEINSTGVVFEGDEVLKNGTLFKTRLDEVWPVCTEELQLRVARHEVLENDKFRTFTLYEDLDPLQKRRIISELMKADL